MNIGVRTSARIVAATAAAALVVGGIGVASAATAESLSPFGLTAGQTLPAGQSLSSKSGQYVLTMQTDGNLVEYGNGSALWATHTEGNPGATLTMQTDDNAVVYSSAHRALWNSKTSDKAFAHGSLSVGDDGHVDLFKKTNEIEWQNGSPATNTLIPVSSLSTGEYLHVGQATLTMQGDGNLVESVNGKAVWSSRTNGHPASYAVFQADGNLVVYTEQPTALWSTKTSGSKATRLTLAANGALTLTTGSAVLWKAP